MNIIRQWLERRRVRMEQELADVKENIHIVYQEIIELKTLTSSIHKGAVDVGSQFERSRHGDRLQDIKHDEMVLRSLEKKRDQLRKKLGHT